MLACTLYNLGRLEDLLAALDYRVRYEKGSFRTGACMLQNTRVIVVNKFSNLEIRMQSLIQLLQEMDIDVSALDQKQRELYKLITKEGATA